MSAYVILMLLCHGEQRIEVPIDDTPFNQRHGFEASMQQSLALTTTLSVLGGQAIDLAVARGLAGKPGWLRMLVFVPATFAWIFLLSQLPLGMTWMHEEWHRAVLTSNGVKSRNGVYSATPFSMAISVDHVSDAELAAFKAASPAGFVRMSAAGIESQTELNRGLERQWFFDDRPPFRDHAAVVWSLLNSFVYLAACALPLSDQITDGYNAAETDVEQRDFTGLDCNAWAYDLEYPDDSYEVRGVHPSGTGVNRYRSHRDLTLEGRSFLQSAMWLSLFGFVTPGWGTSSLKGVRGTRWSFGFFHELTSFGQTIDFELWLRLPFGDFLAVYHQYFNARIAPPGLELGVVRLPVSDTVRLSVTLMGWLQPSQPGLFTTAMQPGGMLRVNALWQATPRAYLWAEADAKTAGWVGGVVYLEPAIQLRIGVGALL